MKITVNKLIDYLGSYVPKELESLEEGKFLVLYYDIIKDINYDNEYLMINPDYETAIVDKIYPVSEVVYMHRKNKNNYYAIPYMVETSDFILFQYILANAYNKLLKEGFTKEELKLKTTNVFEDIVNKYKVIVEDEKKQENVDLIDYTSSVLNIDNVDSTNKFINRKLAFSRKDIPYVKTVFNEFNKFFYNITRKYLFGDIVVGLHNSQYSSEFGILPAYSSSYLRYFFFGRIGLPDDESFDVAFDMAKGGATNKSIFKKTGWFYRRDDEKWHKLVDLVDFRIDKEKLKSVYEGRRLYIIPKSIPDEVAKSYIVLSINKDTKGIEKINDILPNLEDIIENGDYLFKTYPHLKKIKIYFISRIDGDDNYYATSMGGKEYLVIDNSNNIYCLKEDEELAYNFIYSVVVPVIIHEIQHRIQVFEKFGQGGNVSMVSIINKIGGELFGKILFIADMIIDKINNLTNYNKKNILNTLNEKTNIFSLLFENNISSQGIFELQKYIMNDDSFLEFIEVLNKYKKRDISALFVAIKENLKSLNNKLKENEGKVDKNTDRYVNFEFYRGLLGEIESRDAQYRSQTKYILSDYFFPYSYSDISDRFKISNNSEMLLNGNLPFSALETLQSGKYIIHFRDGQPLMIVPFIHEIGHIIFDLFISNYHYKIIEEYYIKNRINKYKSVEEFFCNYWVSYLMSNNEVLKILNIKEKFRDEVKMLNLEKEDVVSVEINNILSGLIKKGFFKEKNNIINHVDKDTASLYLKELINIIKN